MSNGKTESKSEEIRKIFLNPDAEDFRSIYCSKAGTIWGDFIEGITHSIGNRGKNKYPLAKVNTEDNSITFVLSSEVDSADFVDSEKFEKTLNNPDIIEQLEYYRIKKGLTLTGGKTHLLEKGVLDPVTELVEYRINLDTRNLDEILKLNPKYSSREDCSILKLDKTFIPKPGIISLFPIFPIIEENCNLLKSAGCQMIEIPSVQLRRFLPGYDNKDMSFHWVPKDVAKWLSLGSDDFTNILNKICHDNEMLQQEVKLRPQDSEGSDVISNPTNSASVRVVEIDENTKNFYLMYGNTGSEELNNCKSVEINTVDFFKYIHTHLNEKLIAYQDHSFFKDRPEEIQAVNCSILLTEILIIKEELNTEAQKRTTQETKLLADHEPESKKLIELEAQLSNNLNILGQIHLNTKNLEEAVNSFQRSILLYPNSESKAALEQIAERSAKEAAQQKMMDYTNNDDDYFTEEEYRLLIMRAKNEEEQASQVIPEEMIDSSVYHNKPHPLVALVTSDEFKKVQSSLNHVDKDYQPVNSLIDKSQSTPTNIGPRIMDKP